MILEEEFELQDIWKIACEGDEMTLSEQKEMHMFIDMLPHSKCTTHTTSNMQHKFIQEVLPDLFRKRISEKNLAQQDLPDPPKGGALAPAEAGKM